MTKLVLGILMLSCLLRADDKEERATLKGVKNFCVVVEDPGANANSDGLTKDQILTDVELKLRKAGVNVIENTATCFAYVYVFAHVLKLVGATSGLYAYNLEVSFIQPAQVVANSTTKLVATWSTGGFLGTVGRDFMARSVRDSIADFIDKFLNAYLSVNPK